MLTSRRVYRHETPLHVAAQTGELDICRLLMKQGADVTFKARDGWTALHLASRYGHFGIVQELLVHGADVNDQKEDLWTSLHLASAEHLEIVQSLVRHGAALENTNADQETALHIASRCGNLKIACFLIEQGTNTTSKDRMVMHRCTTHQRFRHGYLDLVEIFPEGGVDINVRNANDETPLALASGHGNFEVARFLIIEHGADLNCCDKLGWTPLHTAAQNGHLDIVQLFLDHGLGVQVRNGITRPH